MTGVVGIDHVQIAAPLGCETAARAFYGRLLGLAEIEKPVLLAARGGCWFAIGTTQLHIGVDDPFRPAVKAHSALLIDSTDGLEDLAGRLSAEGIEVVWADVDFLLQQDFALIQVSCFRSVGEPDRARRRQRRGVRNLASPQA